jgi:hypothetical protein
VGISAPIAHGSAVYGILGMGDLAALEVVVFMLKSYFVAQIKCTVLLSTLNYTVGLHSP